MLLEESLYRHGASVRVTLNRAWFAGGFNSRVGCSIMDNATNKFSPEVRERAVQIVLDSEGHGHSGIIDGKIRSPGIKRYEPLPVP
jgi:hypothetical protein